MGKNIYIALKVLISSALQVGPSRLPEVEALLTELEAANRALLHPLVVIWVSSYRGCGSLKNK